MSRPTTAAWAVGVLVAFLCLGAGPAFAHSTPGAAKPKHLKPRRPTTKLRILASDQDTLLSKGLRVKLSVKLPKQRHRHGHHKRKAIAFRLRGASSTFDSPGFSALTDVKTLHFRKSGSRTVTLRVTGSARAALASCQARTLRAQVGKRSVTANLGRTGACAPQPIDLSRASDCDFIGTQQTSKCLLPFPDDYYTRADPTSATGRRIDLRTSAMPDNAAGTHIDAGPYALNDGFSPGEAILVRVPGLDNPAALAQTDAAPINHIGRYAEPNTPVVVIDASTGKRLPIWVEIDSNATSPGSTLLEIHPAVNYESGHRYIVAMRDLKRSDGSVIPAPEGFRYYRDDLPAGEDQINARRDHFDSLFNQLRDAGIQRSNLYLAWDFTTASDENIAGRELHIRNDAFTNVLHDSTLADGVVNGDAPAFTVTSVAVNPDPGGKPEIARDVKGTFTVPCYMTNGCMPGGVFDLDSSGDPIRHGDYQANYECIIPHVAVDGLSPPKVRPATYGHGLFGSAGEVGNSPTNRTLMQSHGFIMCATDEIGMSSQDFGNTASILQDLSKFPQLADRLQQGLLNELFLGRLMDNPAGFAGYKAFHRDQTVTTVDGHTMVSPDDPVNPSVIDTSQFYYIGASQGGIMGGALTAVSPDSTRDVLNVPAMNYSVLLPRSVDYDQFALILNQQYDELERPLNLDLIQMLWDRGEPDGYAHRMTTNPLPDTPPHKVLMNIAFGDHQVTNFQADVEARTIGASTRDPIVYPGRFPDVDMMWNVPRIESFPFDGSAAIYGDIGPVRPADPMNPAGPTIGTPAPPLTNTPNRLGEDPHGAPRGAPGAVALIDAFLEPNGAVTNVCGDTACFSGGFTGP